MGRECGVLLEGVSQVLRETMEKDAGSLITLGQGVINHREAS